MLFGDQQEIGWPRGSGADWKSLPDLQVVRVGSAARDNSWIADFRTPDAIADVESTNCSPRWSTMPASRLDAMSRSR